MDENLTGVSLNIFLRNKKGSGVWRGNKKCKRNRYEP